MNKLCADCVYTDVSINKVPCLNCINQRTKPNWKPAEPSFKIGDYVEKVSGAAWSGRIVGTYSTSLTPEGYCVESAAHPGSVQIYPAKALVKICLES